MNAFEEIPRVRIPLGNAIRDSKALVNKETIKSFGNGKTNFIIRFARVILIKFRF